MAGDGSLDHAHSNLLPVVAIRTEVSCPCRREPCGHSGKKLWTQRKNQRLDFIYDVALDAITAFERSDTLDFTKRQSALGKIDGAPSLLIRPGED
jgi:hypothetical protein